MKPSVAGLALAMDITKEYLWEIRVGRKGKNPDIADTIKRQCNYSIFKWSIICRTARLTPCPVSS